MPEEIGKYVLMEFLLNIPPNEYPGEIATIPINKLPRDAVTKIRVYSLEDFNIEDFNTENLDNWASFHVSTISVDKSWISNAIMAVSNASSVFPPSEIGYLLPQGFNDWSNMDFISFWFKSNVGFKSTFEKEKFVFLIRDKDQKFSYWIFDYETPGTWQKVVIPLRYPNVSNNPSLKKVNGFSIQVFYPSNGDLIYWVSNFQFISSRGTREHLREISKEPHITYDMISPTKYEVHVQTQTPFILIFSETYNDYWKAYIQGETKELTHFPANIYANGWYVEKSGQYTITIDFEPQKFVRFELSLISLIVIIAYNCYSLFSNKGKQLYDWLKHLKKRR
jgi:hypothetical protein